MGISNKTHLQPPDGASTSTFSPRARQPRQRSVTVPRILVHRGHSGAASLQTKEIRPSPRPLAHDAAANNIRAVAAPSPPRSSARLDGPPAPIPTAASRPKLRWQPVPAAAAAAAAAAATTTPRRGKHVWAVRKFHERPDHAARIAAGPERHPIRTGIPGAKCWSCPLPRPGARLRD